MTTLAPSEQQPLVQRIRSNCVGQPAKIQWPHRILHEAADRIEELESALSKLEAGTHVLLPVEQQRRLLTSAKILQQNSEGCAVNHHGEDIYLHGWPGWLLETKADIESASALLQASQEDG